MSHFRTDYPNSGNAISLDKSDPIDPKTNHGRVSGDAWNLTMLNLPLRYVGLREVVGDGFLGHQFRGALRHALRERKHPASGYRCALLRSAILVVPLGNRQLTLTTPSSSTGGADTCEAFAKHRAF